MTKAVIVDEVSLHDQIHCVMREIGLRQRVYPRWVSAGRMKQDKADREIKAMRAVLYTLDRLLAERQEEKS